MAGDPKLRSSEKPFQDGCEAAELTGSKDLGKTDPDALDELEEMEA